MDSLRHRENNVTAPRTVMYTSVAMIAAIENLAVPHCASVNAAQPRCAAHVAGTATRIGRYSRKGLRGY